MSACTHQPCHCPLRLGGSESGADKQDVRHHHHKHQRPTKVLVDPVSNDRHHPNHRHLSHLYVGDSSPFLFPTRDIRRANKISLATSSNSPTSLVNNNNHHHQMTDAIAHCKHRRQRQPPLLSGASARLRSRNSPLVILSLSLIIVTLIALHHATTTLAALMGPADQYPMFSSGASGGGGPSSCPLVAACHCKWSNGKQHAECSNANLSNIPSQIPQDTQVLDLRGNNLSQQLTRYVFQEKHLTNLQKLYLSECRIATIANEAFVHLTNLFDLDLSRNALQQVPTRAFEPLKHSLRRLNLANNPIQVLEQDTFSQLSQLEQLDLNNCQLSQLRPHAFRGLISLRELRLADNRLAQFPLNVMSDLRGESNQIITTEMFGNPWNCDCELRQSIDWMSRHNIVVNPEPTCAMPARHKDIRWAHVKPEDYVCPPTIVNKPMELVVGAGSNVSLSCSAKGSAPIFFVWFQDEKNMTTMRPANATEPPASTKLLEERRYEIAEELGANNVTTSYLYLFNLKLTDTSLFLCWAENGGGYSVANFSLTVNDSPPAGLPGDLERGDSGAWYRAPWFGGSGDRGETQLGLVVIVFAMILITVVILLLLVRHQSGRSSKSSQSSDVKSPHHHHHVSAPILVGGGAGNPLKFSNSHRLATMESDDDDGDNYDDNDGRSSSGGSCRKNPKMMAVSNLDGFIEHMRSGIVNMDLHTMSPVIQFNKQQQQPASQQPYLDTTSGGQHMHHFPSASNASSLPYYNVNGGGSGGAGSASMATTTSDLSPSGSGTTTTNFHTHHAHQHQPSNCDPIFEHQHHHHHLQHDPLLATNDFQGGQYVSGGELDELHPNNLMMPPMYYEHHLAEAYQQQQPHPMYTMGSTTSSMRPTSLIIQPTTQQQPQPQQPQGVLHNMSTLQRQQQQQRNLDTNFHVI